MPFGKKHARQYRIGVVEEREKLTSDPSEVIGTYNPQNKKVEVDRTALDKWIKMGAQVTPSLRKLLAI